MRLTRRRALALAVAGALGDSGIGRLLTDGANGGDAPDAAADHTRPREVTDGVWVGPADAKAAVTAPDQLYLATDADADYLRTEDGWVAFGTGGSPAETAATQSIGVTRVDPSEGYDGLQDALDERGASPSTVLIGPGTIDDIDGNVRVPANTWLRGAGQFSTTLRFADGTDLDLAGLVRVAGDGVVVSDLGVDGNRGNVDNDGQEYGVYVDGSRNVQLRQLHVRNCPGYGIDPHSNDGTPARNVVVAGCVTENNGNDGITLAGIRNAVVANNVSVRNDRHGFNATDAEGDYCAFVGNHAYDNGRCGFAVQNDVGRTTLLGGSFRGNETGIRIGSNGGEVAATTVADVAVEGNEGYGVQIRGSRRITVSGVFFRENAGSDGNAELSIQDTGQPSERVIVNGCQFEGSTTYGVDERTGNGPTTVVGCAFDSGYDVVVNLEHPDSERGTNLT